MVCATPTCPSTGFGREVEAGYEIEKDGGSQPSRECYTKVSCRLESLSARSIARIDERLKGALEFGRNYGEEAFSADTLSAGHDLAGETAHLQ